jgi:hypothetical protein
VDVYVVGDQATRLSSQESAAGQAVLANIVTSVSRSQLMPNGYSQISLQDGATRPITLA